MRTYLFCLLFLAGTAAFSQGLPKHLTEEEKQALPAYLEKFSREGGISTPPASAVRTPAEWEEVQGILVTYTYQKDILRQIIKYAREECKVYIICTDSIQVKQELISDNISLSNIYYIHAPYNSIWIRDYGPWSVYTNDVDSLLLVDWIYNRPRPKDDTIPAVFANLKSYPLHTTTSSPFDLIATGGNFMVDGFGTAFSSELILDENPNKSLAQIEDIMQQFLGIDRYIFMQNLPYDGIHHIDMHMKLLDEETLLVGEYPAGTADGPQIEANIQYILNNYQSVFGTPYKIVRIPMPPDQYDRFPDQNGYYRTFTNSVFINKTLLVPVYEPQYDTTALRILREELPGYNVVGINCNSIIPASGAIHCITKLVAAEEPLLISHQPLEDQMASGTGYDIEALINTKTGVQSAYIFYRTDTTMPYDSVAMVPLSGGANRWLGNISSTAGSSEIYYYIKANAISGRFINRPMPAPEGYWHFNILNPAAVDNMSVENILSIGEPFPNPATDKINILVKVTYPVETSIYLMNLSGQHVIEVHTGDMDAGDYRLTINSNKLYSGIYFLQCTTPGGNIIKKIMIQ